MEIPGGQNDAFVAVATRRARDVVRGVAQGLEQGPQVNPGLLVDRHSTHETYGNDVRQDTDYIKCLRGDSITQEKRTDRTGSVVRHSLETYHEAPTEAGDHSTLLSMSRRQIPGVVSQICGFLGGLGVLVQPRDSVLYKRQTDRWDGVQLGSHRTTEQVRVYDDGAVYHRSDDRDSLRVFLPGFKVDEPG